MITTTALYEHYLKCIGIAIDSRNIEKGMLFFALKGERVDGHEFIEKAFQKGADFAIIDDPQFKLNNRCLLCNDVLITLQELASFHRNQLKIPFIAITGTNGKTTTKELTTAILKTSMRVAATKGNYNNHIGIPLTLLSIPLDCEIAVVEMGANHLGEIANYCKWVRPTHGCITNIGKAHLEGFGSLEGVLNAKTELYDYLRKVHGIAFVNTDHEYLLPRCRDMNIESYSAKSLKIMKQSETEFPTGIQFLFDGQSITSSMNGWYNLENILAALTIGNHFNVPTTKMAQAVASYVPNNNRSQIVYKNSNVYYLDAYNANPTSMRAALEHFIQIPSSHKVVVLGDMLELGEYSEREHREILDFLKKQKLNRVILVGPEFQNQKKHGFEYFENVTALRDAIVRQPLKDSQVLIKGSRKIQLEKLLE